jgi:hypothetical protein
LQRERIAGIPVRSNLVGLSHDAFLSANAQHVRVRFVREAVRLTVARLDKRYLRGGDSHLVRLRKNVASDRCSMTIESCALGCNVRARRHRVRRSVHYRV